MKIVPSMEGGGIQQSCSCQGRAFGLAEIVPQRPQNRGRDRRDFQALKAYVVAFKATLFL